VVFDEIQLEKFNKYSQFSRMVTDFDDDDDDEEHVIPVIVKNPETFYHAIEFLNVIGDDYKEPKYTDTDEFMANPIPTKIKSFFDRLEMSFIETDNPNYKSREKEVLTYKSMQDTALYLGMDILIQHLRWYHFQRITDLKPSEVFILLEREKPYNPTDFGFETEEQHIEHMLFAWIYLIIKILLFSLELIYGILKKTTFLLQNT